MKLKRVIIETAKQAVKDNDREMKVALMNRYLNSKEIHNILFGKEAK